MKKGWLIDFLFSSRRRHTRYWRDWSSDVCSSDLKGLGYCATCDAPLYKDKIVTIIGYNKESQKDANYVSELASIVYYVPMNNEELNLNNKIKIIRDIPKEVIGDRKSVV